MTKWIAEMLLQIFLTAVWFGLFAYAGAPKWLALIGAAVTMQLGLIEVRLSVLNRKESRHDG